MSKLQQDTGIFRISIVLFLGVFLILVASCFLVLSYWQRSHTSSVSIRAFEVTHVISLATKLSSKKFETRLSSLNYPGLELAMISAPAADAIVIKQFDEKEIRSVVLKNREKLLINVPLRDGRWLSIAFHPRIMPMDQLLGYGVVGLVLLMALGSLCVLTLRHLALPLQEIAHLNESVDNEALWQPLPETGVPLLRLAIRTINRLQARLLRLVEDKTLAMAAISHDLRTPLTRLRLRIEDQLSESQSKRLLSDISEMEYMIHSILTYARGDYHEESRARLDLVTLIESLCHDRLDMGQAVVFESTAERFIYEGRSHALKRALNNIVDNAIKYGQRAEVKVMVKEQQCWVTVIDQGPSIPTEEREKVLRAFYRVNVARTPISGSTGLGLTVAYDILKAHQATLNLTDAPGGGLKVEVIF